MVTHSKDLVYKMQLQLFYLNSTGQDLTLEAFIRDQGCAVDGLFMEEHRQQYDHNDDSSHPKHHGGSCFCDLPDYSDPVWPKLYNSYEYVTAGSDAIRALDFSKLK